MLNKLKIAILLGGSLLMNNVFTHPAEELEPLYAAQLFAQELVIKVSSNGCTRAKNFIVEQIKDGDTVQLRIQRQQADQCRAMPRIIEISLPFSASKNIHYYIANPWLFSPAKVKNNAPQ